MKATAHDSEAFGAAAIGVVAELQAEVERLRAGIREIIDEEREQATANEEGFSYRHGNNLFNGGAATAQRAESAPPSRASSSLVM